MKRWWSTLTALAVLAGATSARAQHQPLDILLPNGSPVMGGIGGGVMGGLLPVLPPDNDQVRSVQPDQFIIRNELPAPVSITVLPDHAVLPPVASGAELPLPCHRVTAIQLGAAPQPIPVACQKTYAIIGSASNPVLVLQPPS